MSGWGQWVEFCPELIHGNKILTLSSAETPNEINYTCNTSYIIIIIPLIMIWGFPLV